jgi:hypothetical protein
VKSGWPLFREAFPEGVILTAKSIPKTQNGERKLRCCNKLEDNEYGILLEALMRPPPQLEHPAAQIAEAIWTKDPAGGLAQDSQGRFVGRPDSFVAMNFSPRTALWPSLSERHRTGCPPTNSKTSCDVDSYSRFKVTSKDVLEAKFLIRSVQRRGRAGRSGVCGQFEADRDGQVKARNVPVNLRRAVGGFGRFELVGEGASPPFENRPSGHGRERIPHFRQLSPSSVEAQMTFRRFSSMLESRIPQRLRRTKLTSW